MKNNSLSSRIPFQSIRKLLCLTLILVSFTGWDSPSPGSSTRKESILVDERDNKTYRIDTINGRWWTLDNAAFDAPGSLCYDNASSNCKNFGKIYNWDQAKQSCPKGWRLPTHQELIALLLPYGKISYDGQDSLLKKIFGRYEPEITDTTYTRISSDKTLNIPALSNPVDYSNPIQQRTMFWTSDDLGSTAYAIYWDRDGNDGKGAVHFSDYPKDFFGFCRFVKESETK